MRVAALAALTALALALAGAADAQTPLACPGPQSSLTRSLHR